MVRWQPAHEAHAIERVCVTFRFPQDMPDKQWQKLLGSQTPKLQQESFGFADMRLASQIIIGPADVPQPPLDISNVPANRRIFRSESTGEELQLQPSQLIYFTSRYISWNYFKERMISLLSQFLHETLSVLNINIVKLEYWDRFVFNGEPNNVAYGELFRFGSRHFPNFLFDQVDLWHSHIGYFASSELNVKRLINFNVDILDIATAPDANSQIPGLPKRSAGLYSMAQDSIEASAAPDNLNKTEEILDQLHAILKDVLADALTAEAANRIALHSHQVSL